MQKDVIYIDTEDDITAIIGKVKASKSHIVALVPPKRIGAIQSAVNLKLVQRATEQAGKRLVLITNNQALSALASSAAIPIAKNLQSKPEMTESPVHDTDDDDDIIDGNSIPNDTASDEGTDSSDSDVESDTQAAAGTVGAVAVASAAKGKLSDAKTASSARVAAVKARGRTVIPNFDSFRKRLFLIAGGAVALLVFLIWAIFFAAQAKITIAAKTTGSALNSKVTFASSATTSLKNGTLKSETKSTSKDVSVPVTATGKKDIGEKATGQVKFVNSSPNAATIAAGTQLTSSTGLVFVVASEVTVPGAQLSFSCAGYLCPGTVNGSVVAAAPGENYNAASGSLGGTPSGVSASFTAPTGGGTTKVVAVIQQSDIDAVASDITKASESEAAKEALKNTFGGNYTVIDGTFKVDASAVKPTPAVGAEAPEGKGVLSGKVVYTMVGILKTELGTFLDAYYAQQIEGKTNQKVYNNGVGSVSFASVAPAEGDTWHAALAANGEIGPKIDENDLKNFAKGKKIGEIKTYVEAIQGVDTADVNLSPFWVLTAPNDINRIKVEFKLNG